ncbi:MAG: surface protein containing Ig-like domain-like, partial [Paenibacillus sp.]|nr:surface protein containing Ig-like domain-like [Paenibacillus sp.]
MFKTKIVSFLLLFLIVSLVIPNPLLPIRQAEADEVWIPVNDAAELSNIRSNLTGSFKLSQDIDLGTYDFGDGGGWKPIANFTGKLDGNGFVIRNLKINRPGDNQVGLFATTTGATISNVHLTNIDVTGNSDVGGLGGWLTTSVVSSSSAEGHITGKQTMGLLVGYSSLTDISDSYTQGQLAIESESYSKDFGGLIGYRTDNGTKGKIVRSYSTAFVQSGTNSGGLSGRTDGGLSATSSYWNTNTSGQSGSADGTGKTTEEMRVMDTFTGWDFLGTGSTDPIWGMVERATYPLHYADYKKVALASLTVKNGDDIAQKLDRDFASDYGVYAVQVENKTSQVVVSGNPLSPASTVSVDGGAASKTLTLNPGPNDFNIEVSDPADPARLKAVYKLTVYRDAGTALYPHRITTADQLSKIGDAAEGYGLDQVYELDADLDLSGYTAGAGWTPIGSAAEPFQGIFKGNDHTIVHLKIDRPGADHIGLFGATSGATMSNVALPDVDIRGNRHVGGLIGHADNTSVSGISVQGTVSGTGDAAGLIGSAAGSTSVSESYAAAAVTAAGGDAGGLIASGAAGGAVTHSFWDSERSGQPFSSGGGTSMPTSEMMKKTTYADYPGSIWEFGSGKRWGMIEGTTYPMPYASYTGVIPLGLAVTAAGTTVTLSPSSFDPAKGVYAAALAAPVPQASVTVSPAVGQTVAINSVAGASSSIDLGLGEQSVEIMVKGANGASGAYRLTLTVPSPTVQTVQVPSSGTYGIGAELEFVAAYDFAVDVDASQAPGWPIGLDGSPATTAAYIGKLGGDSKKLRFRYTVQEGELSSAGIVPGSALAAPAASSITANGEAVSTALP